jgi:hypothetical protein
LAIDNFHIINKEVDDIECKTVTDVITTTTTSSTPTTTTSTPTTPKSSPKTTTTTPTTTTSTTITTTTSSQTFPDFTDSTTGRIETTSIIEQGEITTTSEAVTQIVQTTPLVTPVKVVQQPSILWMIFCIIFFVLCLVLVAVGVHLFCMNRTIFRHGKSIARGSPNSDIIFSPFYLPRLQVVKTNNIGREIIGNGYPEKQGKL